MKFNLQDLKDLTEHQVLLIINFATMTTYCNTEANTLFNCYIEGTDLLTFAKSKLKLSDEDVDFLYNFFLENDHY